MLFELNHKSKLMKTTLQLLSGVLLTCLFFFGQPQRASAQCSASFSYSIGANGLVNFYSTGANSFTTSYYWYSNGALTYSGSGFSGTTTSINYTANGTYTVMLWVFSSSPSCS